MLNFIAVCSGVESAPIRMTSKKARFRKLLSHW